MNGNKIDAYLQRPNWIKRLVEEPIDKKDIDSRNRHTLPWTALFFFVVALLGFAASLVQYLRWRQTTTLTSTIIWAIVIVTLVVLRPRTFSLLLAALYIALTVLQTSTIVWFNDQHGVAISWGIVSIILSLVSLLTVLNMQIRPRVFPRTGISQPFSTPTAELRSPEDDLTMWQWMTVSWMAPLINVGKKRQLNDDDVWLLAYEFQHSPLHEAFRTLTGTVVTRLLKANWLDILLLTLLSSIEISANYSAPLILQRLLQAMQRIDVEKKPAIIWGSLTLLVQFCAAQSGVFSLWFSRRAYERSRGAMITMLHEKVLHRKILGGKPKDDSEKEGNGHVITARTETEQDYDENDDENEEANGLISGKKKQHNLLTTTKSVIAKVTACIPSKQKKSIPDEKEPASMGKILNLMRNDVYETAQRFWEFQMLINTPVGLILSLILVWRLIGWASLFGIAVVILAQIIIAFFARILLSWEKVRRKATDHKLQQITQYVEAIRHLRWYGWHTRKLEVVLEARQKELNIRIITFIWNNAIMFVNTFASGVLPVAAFWAFTTLAGRKLSVDIAFPALQLFTLLQTNLRDVPNVITVLLNAAVAVGRIEDFMSEPDVAAENTVDLADHLEVKGASFAWPGIRKNVLHQLNLTFPQGLTVIVGPVASGKTALLQALLGELDLRGGRLIKPDTPIGYCAQTPWLESMTIKDNILFCSPYEEARYKHVLEACALLPDLASFKQGDLSPIGENGIGLSGGQKARVALARAIYSRANILLLDDPLSALDQQTAEWIVSKCLSGSLIENRTVLLVTHRIDLCQGISQQTIEMSNGQARIYEGSTATSNGFLTLTKTNSTHEQEEVDKSAAVREKFEDAEHREHGGVEIRVYWEYVKAGKLRWWFWVVITILLWRLFDYAQNWFLKEWGEAYQSTKSHFFVVLQSITIRPAQASPISRLFEGLPDPSINPKPWLVWFMILVILQAVSFLLSQVLMLVVTYTAGKNMFARIMTKISNATFLFYDVTPVGRLMNRLTGDVSTVDGPISNIFLGVAWESVAWILSVVVIASVTPLFLVFSIALAAAFVFIFLRFLPTSQSLRRLEMVSLSPLMSNFGALLNGLMTVRAFHAQSQFQNRVVDVTDNFQKMDHFYWSLQSWLSYRFECLSALSTFLLTLLAVYSGLSPGLTAFVLIAAQRFVQSTHRLCKQYGTLQLDFVSVERVVELLDLDQEDPGSALPPAYWPSLSSQNPAVEFEDVTVRYAPHMDPALKNVSFSIPAGSSTAIIGRTGSGKSTLALATLATIKPDSGRILIDGIDISKVMKQDLRTRITFLAQDPILFQGTLRTNLDPMDDYSDEECTSVLQRIHGDVRYNWNLETAVDTGGRNLSQGQRQLVGLARAILRRSAIIIMDEATASVDLETSWEVQRVLKEELAGSTVITIAHRASAVRDCDLVVKLDKGRLAAFGPPSEVEILVDASPRGDEDDGDDDGGVGGGGSNAQVNENEEHHTEEREEHQTEERQHDHTQHQHQHQHHTESQHTRAEQHTETAHQAEDHDHDHDQSQHYTTRSNAHTQSQEHQTEQQTQHTESHQTETGTETAHQTEEQHQDRDREQDQDQEQYIHHRNRARNQYNSTDDDLTIF